MSRYTQLTREQRHRIYILKKAVQTQTQTEIASTPGVHKSTISRELCRNRGGKGYGPRPISSPVIVDKPKIVPALPRRGGILSSSRSIRFQVSCGMRVLTTLVNWRSEASLCVCLGRYNPYYHDYDAAPE